MKHRISAGAFVEHQGRLLLVREQKVGAYDFWVAPGGGVNGTEDLADAAVREVREETGLLVAPTKLVYVEEFHSPDTRFCKFWFTATLVDLERCEPVPETDSTHIVDAAWHTEAAIRALQVFPRVLQERYWQDRAAGFPGLKHLGLRAMEFW